MTKTQRLHRLLFALLDHDCFQISSADLNREYRTVGLIAVELGWLVENYAKRFKCPECGKTHPVEVVGGRFFIGCDVSEHAEATEITKNELRVYIFSVSRFMAWLNAQLKLSGMIKKIGDYCWYLGQLNFKGGARKVYFVQQNRFELVPNSMRGIVLTIGLDQHSWPGDGVNILKLIRYSDGGFKLDRKRLRASSVIESPDPNALSVGKSGRFLFEMKLISDDIVMTGSILDNRQLPVFRSKKSAFYKFLRTMLKLHNLYAPEKLHEYDQKEVVKKHQSKGNKNEVEEIDLVKSRRVLAPLCRCFIRHLLQRSYRNKKMVISFRSAIGKVDYDSLLKAKRKKIENVARQTISLVNA